MLHITVVLTETFDEKTRKFGIGETFDLDLEHSLVSLSKWESNFEKAFLSRNDKTQEELLWYIRAMVLTPGVPEEIFSKVSQKNLDEISSYIDSAQTATKFPDTKKPNNETITADLIYYWMIALNVPFECQHWHLNRLLTLIRVCNQHNAPQKKLTKQELLARQRELNERRKKEMNTRG